MNRSRWAEDEEDTAQAIAQRKREKEERTRLRKERSRTTEPAQNQAAAAAREEPKMFSKDHSAAERPSKRRRLSNDKDADHTAERQTPQPLQFPSFGFGPCKSVELYERLNDIEEGSYGLVSRARENSTGVIVALKRLKMDYCNDGFPVTGLREIQTLFASRSHANIVNLREVVMGSTLKDVFLVMDFLEHDLKTLLQDMSEPFLPSEIKTLLLQITSATSYLHANYILHRDLKTSNLLLNNRGEIKLADFGMARYTSTPPPPNLTQLVVTLWYRAPELLLGATSYGSEIDIWSLGCIFSELLTRNPLFTGKNEVEQLSKIFSLLGAPSTSTWPAFRTLPNAKALHPVLSATNLQQPRSIPSSKFPYLTSSGLAVLNDMLSLNPAHRPSADEILRHPYFAEEPRPKAKDLFPTFPSRAGQERRRTRDSPAAPIRGDAPRLGEQDFAGVFGGSGEEQEGLKGAGFALKMGR